MKKLIFILLLMSADKVFAQWQKMHITPGSSILTINDFCFLNDSVGFAACYEDDLTPGAIFKTTDGGTSWVMTSFPQAMIAVQFISNDTGYAIGYSAKIYRTIDQGANWSLINTLSPWIYVHSIYFKNHHESYIGSDIGFCPNCPGVLLKSTDGWQTFSCVPFDTTGAPNYNSHIYDVFFINADTGFAVSNDLWYTHDGGNTWHINTQLGNLSPTFNSLMYNKWDSTIWTTGEYNIDGSNYGGSLYHSTDNGNTWAEPWHPSPFYGIDTVTFLFDGQFVTGSIGYVVGGPKYASITNATGIAKTEDGGVTWIDDPIPANNCGYLFSIDCPSSKVCYVGGTANVLLKKTNADSVASGISKVTSAKHNSQLAVYPNPVVAVASIEYQTTKAGKSTVTVENCLGQTVTSVLLTNNQKQTINMSSYASGMYFIKCFDGREQTVIKVVKN